MKKISKVVNLSICLFTIKFCSQSFASTQTQNGNMQVSATVVATCTMTTNPLPFGSYHTAGSTVVSASANLAVTCTNGAPYNIQMNGGSSNSVTARTMVLNSNSLNYKILTPTNTNWGQTIGTDTYGGTGTGAVQNIPVNGSITVGQNVPLGSYQDTITITINY